MRKNIVLRFKTNLFYTLAIVLLYGCYGPQKTAMRQADQAIHHIIHMGQSLGAGDQSLPLVTDSATGFGNLRFAMGTHTWTGNIFPSQPELRNPANFMFVPLTAVQRGGEGETIANGMCDHLSETINAMHGKRYRFLFSYAGQGGRYLRELNKRHDDAKDERAGNRRSGGGYYKTSIDDVRRAKKMADSLGIDYSVFGITWMQGEANAGRRLNRWDPVLSDAEVIQYYKNDLIELMNDYQHDISAITGQRSIIPFFTYQTAGHLAGVAQLQASNEANDIFLVAPTYMLPNAENGHYYVKEKLLHGDGIHLTADGERWLGEQFGKVMRKVIVEGKDWKPLQPLNAWMDTKDNSVYVRFMVPEPPLVIDTLFLPRQDTGLGFTIYDNNRKKYAIQQVVVIGSDVLKFTLASPLPAHSLYMNYGLQSKVGDLPGAVQSVVTGVKNKDGHDAVDIVLAGNLLAEVATLVKEGVFYLNNIVTEDEKLTNLIIRDVFLNHEGNTVFRGETKDLRNSISFQPGQKCYTARRYTYGNIRDADEERSTFYFNDTSYGQRYGQHYPLHNWLVAFDELLIGPAN